MRILFLILALMAPLPACAQGSEPLEITAEQTLEWHRNDKQYIARGDVEAKQGGMTIRSETLTADYTETEKSSMDIQRLTADTNVRIISEGNTAEGDKAVYDVATGKAVLTGQALRLVSPEQTVTARDRFEYWLNEGRLVALGQAHAVRGEDKIDADSLTAIFTSDPKTGSRTLSRLEADGNVVITTPTETLKGNKGVYTAATSTAELVGNVSIKRGPNILEGDSADVNLTTNVSRMHGSTGAGSGRVRGVFYPGTQKSSGPVGVVPPISPVQ